MDLLWNGGIGTYVKASYETHQHVQDWANDNLRVNGNELRCRVVGEGGNLGFTQLGRIEYELECGGRVNADFIDNAGGVDCSDHEVNAKILLNDVVSAGKLSYAKRNHLLASMSDEVAQLVLDSNYRQHLCISLSVRQQVVYFNFYERYLESEQRKANIDLALSFLPDGKSLSRAAFELKCRVNTP